MGFKPPQPFWDSRILWTSMDVAQLGHRAGGKGEDMQREMEFQPLNHHPEEVNRMQGLAMSLLHAFKCWNSQMGTEKTSDDDVLLEQGLKNIYHNTADP